MGAVMKLFFRIKENGASVFRVDEDARDQRITLVPVAEVNARNANIKLRPQITLTTEESTEIAAWIAERQSLIETQEANIPFRTIEALNAAAHWVSGQPDPEAVDKSTDPLLMAMLDLRTALLRFKSRRGEDQPD